jgi:hypothetical protein
MFCVNCGTKLDEGIRFCSSCGSAVGGVSNTPVTPAPQQSVQAQFSAVPASGVLYLSFVVSVISVILFFFPWFKVLGQSIFAFLGFGSKDGFNLISFYLMINKLMDYASFTFGAKAFCIIIALIMGAGAPFLGLLSHLLNCYSTLSSRKMVTKRIIGGPLWFIIGYYILKYVAKAYVSSAASDEWYGELASMLFGNLVSMTSIPWLLLAFGIMNECFALAWKNPETGESTISQILSNISQKLSNVTPSAVNWKGKTDYIAIVNRHRPYVSYAIDADYGMVFRKYIDSIKYAERKSGKVGYVDISGKLKGYGENIVVTISVTPDDANPDKVKIAPYSVTIGNERFNQNEAVNALWHMFSAYYVGLENYDYFFHKDKVDGALQQTPAPVSVVSANPESETVANENKSMDEDLEKADDDNLEKAGIGSVNEITVSEETSTNQIQQEHFNAAIAKDSISSNPDPEYQNDQQIIEKYSKYAKYKKPGKIKRFLFIIICILLGFFLSAIIVAIVDEDMNDEITALVVYPSTILAPILGNLLLKRRIKKSSEKRQLYVDAMNRKLGQEGLFTFCHKCGSKSVDDAEFCQKCGAKLIVDGAS